MGNFVHFVFAALALVKAVLAGRHSAPALASAAAYTAFAVLFAAVLFGNPLHRKVEGDKA